MSAEYQDVAQICLNGHVINSAAKTYPHLNKKFCDRCGAATIHKCQACVTDIQGVYQSDEEFGVDSNFPAPAFCHNCGNQYPWTSTKIQAAIALAQELEGLTDDERDLFAKSIEDIVGDTPRTTLGVTRFKKIMSKIGKEGAAAFKEILISVVSAGTNKAIWGK